jgi:hypothetical protein
MGDNRMKFAEIVDSLMAGKRVRKTNWESKTAFFLYDKEDNTFDFYEVVDGELCRTQIYYDLTLTSKDLMSDFWEIIE